MGKLGFACVDRPSKVQSCKFVEPNAVVARI